MTTVVVPIVAVIAFAALVLSVGGAAAPSAGNGTAAIAPSEAQADDGTALTVTDADTQPGEPAQFDVVLSELPDGLAGFEITFAVSDPGVAVVTGAEYPDSYDHASEPRISNDGSEITVEAVDLRDEVAPGATDVEVATITVRGEAAGEATLQVTDYQIDADGGARVEPALDRGTVTVGDDAADAGVVSPSEGDATDGSDGENSQDESSASMPGIDDLGMLPIVGALGAIVVAFLVGARGRISWP